MEKLTKIESKFKEKEGYKEIIEEIKRKKENQEELTEEELEVIENLRFIYEIDNEIEGFGYQKDPRIDEILEKRNKKEDLSLIFNCKEEEISLTIEEALRGNIKYHYGGLFLRDITSAEGLKLPENVREYVLINLVSGKGVIFPKSIGGSLFLNSLTSAKGLTLSESIRGDLGLASITSVEGLNLNKDIKGKIYLDGIDNVEKDKLRKKYPNLNIV